MHTVPQEPVALVAGVPGLALVLSVVLRCTWSGTGGQQALLVGRIIDQPADMLLSLSSLTSSTQKYLIIFT